MTAPLPDYYLLRTKDVTTLMNVSKSLAETIIKDIKEWVQEKTGVLPKYILFVQFKRYHGLAENG